MLLYQLNLIQFCFHLFGQEIYLSEAFFFFLGRLSSRWLCWTVFSADPLTSWDELIFAYSVCAVCDLLISLSYNCRYHPASSSRCLALGRNLRCLTRSFPLWSWTSQTSCLKVRTDTHTHGLTWFNTNEHSEYNMWCVFQVLSSAWYVETWHRKSATTVSKTPFSARRDSKSSARSVHLRCRL